MSISRLHSRSPSAARRVEAGAFTLVELLLSLAIATLLILAVAAVFRMTAETVGAGEALSEKGRDYRAVQQVFYDDAASVVMPFSVYGNPSLEDGPFFMIHSRRLTMFRNRADQESDRDGDPATQDLNGDGVETGPGEAVRPAQFSDRSHRLDRLMFFARGRFARQTGGDLASGGRSPLLSDMTSNEAFIWYGHLSLPDFTSPQAKPPLYAHREPGEAVSPAPLSRTQPKNALNFYAADWCLGRMVVTLHEGEDVNGNGAGDVIRDSSGAEQIYLRRAQPPTDFASLAPLNARLSGVPALSGPGGEPWELESSRYDLANTSITQYRQILTGYSRRTDQAAWNFRFEPMRFQANPLPDKPLTAASVARLSPIFLPHCSSFVVEYAGDFVTQDSDPIRGPKTAADDGTVLKAEPDGALDFIVSKKDGSRMIRWYGLPRDADGDGVIEGGRSDNNDMPDVVPLRDVRRTAKQPPATDAAPFERLTNRDGTPRLPLPAGGDYAASMASDASYVVAWGPDTENESRPRMLRVIFTLDDPSGRLSTPQTYSYVLRLP